MFLEHEFEKEWAANGGQPYTKNADRKRNGKQQDFRFISFVYILVNNFKINIILKFNSWCLTKSIYSVCYFLTCTSAVLTVYVKICLLLTCTSAVLRVYVKICLLLTCTSATQKIYQNNLKIIQGNITVVPFLKINCHLDTKGIRHHL